VAPDRIPRELLEAVIRDTDGEAGAAVLDSVDEAIGLLLGYALLTVSGEQTFAMHRLVGRLARTNASSVTRTGAITCAVGALQATFPKASSEYEQWPACERLLSHALDATTYAQRDDVALAETAALLVRAGLYQRERAQYDSACELVQRAVAIYEAQSGPPGPELANALDVLGITLWRLARLSAARDVLQRALVISQSVHGPEHREFARTLCNLGLVQEHLGEFEAARSTHQRALAMMEAASGPEHSDVARTLSNLGSLHQPREIQRLVFVGAPG